MNAILCIIFNNDFIVIHIYITKWGIFPNIIIIYYLMWFLEKKGIID